MTAHLLFAVATYLLNPSQVPDPQDTSDQYVTIQEIVKPGMSVEIKTSVNLTGSLTELKSDAKRPNTISVWASGQSHYRERFLDVANKGEVTTLARRYLKAMLEKERGEAKQGIQLRSAVERIAVERIDDQTTLFSPDGPLTGPELDLLRAESFVPALRGLLPTKPAKTGDQWQASNVAASELTGVSPIESGGLNCVFYEVKSSDSGTMARINFSGTLVGPTDQGPTRLAVDGHLLFDLDQQLVSYILMNGRSEILDSSGKTTGKLEGRYELRRQPAIDDPRLADIALAGVALKPNSENTALLFEAPQLGVRFQYPRNWELVSIAKNNVQFEEPTGGNMRLTFDPVPAPSVDKLQSDLLGWLKQQKATVQVKESAETETLTDALKAERFTVRAEHQKHDKEWTYLIVRNANRSAVLAANFIQDRAEAIRSDQYFVARTLEFFERESPKP
jgi:hypothetical protein